MRWANRRKSSSAGKPWVSGSFRMKYLLLWAALCAAAFGCGPTAATATSVDDIGDLRSAESLMRLMQAISYPLVDVLSELTSVVQTDCSGGGTVSIDRELGEASFTDCTLEGVVLNGQAVLADGGSTDTQKSAILAGGAFTVSGRATGSVLIQLAQFTWQVPRSQASTAWRASFDDGMQGTICVQSSGEAC